MYDRANDRVERAKRANNVEADFARRALSLERRRGQFSARPAKRETNREHAGARRDLGFSLGITFHRALLPPSKPRFDRRGNLFDPLARPWAAKYFFSGDNCGSPFNSLLIPPLIRFQS